MTRRIVTLTTDFGLKDSYVAEMKAVILSMNPKLIIVDITHEIEKFNIRMGAYILASASPYFPKGTIHVAVVDPGVGTRRRPLLVQTRDGFYIGPDNGVLTLAAGNQSIEHVYEIANRKLMRVRISNTFHGRDVFSPAAAYLAEKTPIKEFGPEVHDFLKPSFSKIVRRKNMIVGEVLHVDSFGNIVTNVRPTELEPVCSKDVLKVKTENAKLVLKLCKTYAEAKTHEALATVGSHDFVEISINQGNAAKTFNVKSGDEIIFYRSQSSLAAY